MLKLKKGRGFAGQLGMSIIEVVIVIVVVGIALPPLTRVATKNMKYMGDFAKYSQSLSLAESIVEEVLADYGAPSRGYTYVRNNYSGYGSSVLPSGFEKDVTVSSENTLDGVNYVQVTVKVRGGSNFSWATLNVWISQ
ncbi:MAG TPA: hypothetical protein VGB38_03275 [bacterium]